MQILVLANVYFVIQSCMTSANLVSKTTHKVCMTPSFIILVGIILHTVSGIVLYSLYLYIIKRRKRYQLETMMSRLCLLVTALFWMVRMTAAFAPSSSTKHGMTLNTVKFQTARIVPSYSRVVGPITIRLSSSTEPESESSTPTSPAVVSADGTYYDDEVKIFLVDRIKI